MVIRCTNCKTAFDFSVSTEDDLKKVICPKCEKEFGTFEVNFDLNEMILTEWSPDPIPAPTIKFRSSNPSNPVATVDIQQLPQLKIKD